MRTVKKELSDFPSVKIDDVKLAGRITISSQDDRITSLIDAMTAACEEATGLPICLTTYLSTFVYPRNDSLFCLRSRIVDPDDIAIDSGKVAIRLPKLPVQEIVSVALRESDNVFNTLTLSTDDYYLVGDILYLISAPAFDQTYINVEVTYKAGYNKKEDEAHADLPPILKQAVIEAVVHAYRNVGESKVATLPAKCRSMLRAHSNSIGAR